MGNQGADTLHPAILALNQLVIIQQNSPPVADMNSCLIEFRRDTVSTLIVGD